MHANNPPRQKFSQIPETLRLFFALWPEAEMRASLSALAHRYQAECGGRAMRAETLHLTMLFVGQLPRERLPELVSAIDGLAFPPFEIELDEWRCWRHNRIGYVAPKRPPEAMLDLAHALRERVQRGDLPFDAKAFSPHVTLLRNIERNISVQPVAPLRWRIRRMVLVQSVQTAAGVRYEILRAWPAAT